MLARIYDEMMESIKHLDDNTKWKILLAYVNYELYDIEPSKDDVLVYSIFKAKQFDLDSAKKDIRASVENGMKGWRPEKNWENKQKPKHNLNQPKNNLKEPEKEKEKEKENKKENIKEKKPTALDDVLVEFKKMRKEIKKPITDRWLELVKMKLEKMYPGREDLQRMCLEKSIENSWQGVFELNNNDIMLYKKKMNEDKKVEVEVEDKIELTEEQRKAIRKRYMELRKWVLRW